MYVSRIFGWHNIADIGETVLQNFGLKQWGIGSSFLNSLKV